MKPLIDKTLRELIADHNPLMWLFIGVSLIIVTALFPVLWTIGFIWGKCHKETEPEIAIFEDDVKDGVVFHKYEVSKN